MSRYRRFFVPGGTYFFTVTLADRRSDALVRNVDLLRTVYANVRRRLPFETLAICVLPDHLHAIWSLPEGDADFPKRWQLIKIGFSRALPPDPRRSPSKAAKGEKGIWQRRYWEHAIRDDRDLARQVDYVHFNPRRAGTRAMRARLGAQQFSRPRRRWGLARRLGRRHAHSAAPLRGTPAVGWAER